MSILYGTKINQLLAKIAPTGLLFKNEKKRQDCQNTPVRDKKEFIKKLVVSQIFCIFIGENQLVTKIFDMTTDYKVTELFYIIDEFCKHFDAENAGNLLEDNSGVKRRRRQASLSDSEIMTILLHFPYCIRHSVIPNWGNII